MKLIPDLFNHICNFANVSSIRILYRTSKQFYELGKKHIETKLGNMDPFILEEYPKHYCIEQFTIELLLDGFDIPDSFYTKKNGSICSTLAYVGRLDLLKKSIAKKCSVTVQTLKSAARFGRSDITDYCHTKYGFTWQDFNESVMIAALYGHLDFVKRECSQRYFDPSDIIEQSTIGGHLHILQHYIDYAVHIRWEDAVKCDHQHILEWGTKDGYVTISDLQPYAIMHDRHRILEWTVKQGYPITDEYYDSAIINGATNVIRHVLDNILLIQKSAAKHDAKDVLMMLSNAGHEIDESIFSIAMTMGSQKVMKWMIKNSVVTKQIQFSPIISDKIIELLLQNDLIYLDARTCVILTVHGYLRYFENKIDNIPKSSRHFSVGCGVITQLVYNGGINNGQKLIYLDDNGEIKTSSLENCRCWWFLLAWIGGDRTHIGKIDRCDCHREFFRQMI